jgi:uncharacterized membrane protein YkvI
VIIMKIYVLILFLILLDNSITSTKGNSEFNRHMEKNGKWRLK